MSDYLVLIDTIKREHRMILPEDVLTSLQYWFRTGEGRAVEIHGRLQNDTPGKPVTVVFAREHLVSISSEEADTAL